MIMCLPRSDIYSTMLILFIIILHMLIWHKPFFIFLMVLDMQSFILTYFGLQVQINDAQKIITRHSCTYCTAGYRGDQEARNVRGSDLGAAVGRVG